jgi:general secretion pathway protein L
LSASASLLSSLSRAIDDVATGLARLGSILRRRRRIELAEQADRSFLWRDGGPSEPHDNAPIVLDESGAIGLLPPRLRKLLPGSQVHLILAPRRFVFRTLELPRAATAFLDGVVRSQIDRLSPWKADATLFGWSAPVDVGSDKIALTVAAAARTQVDPIAEGFLSSGAASVEMSTRLEDTGRPVSLMRQTGGETETGRLRLVLVVALVVAGIVCATSLVAWYTLGAGYDAEFFALQNQLAVRRAKVAGEQDSKGMQALNALETKKRTKPSVLLVLEALSKTLPDDAHLTDLRIEGEKVQIVGMANNAPALIPLIEQSGSFAKATFFAPTVRGPNGGDNFHIEAQIEAPLLSRTQGASPQ